MADALLPRRFAERERSCHQHSHQIGHRGSGDEDPARARGKAEHLAHPRRDLSLDFDRNVIASAEIGVEAGGQHFRQHADGGAAAVHPSHEAGMNVAGRIRRDEIGEFAIDLAEVRRLTRQRCAELPANRIRNRLPYRASAYPRDVIDHVIEHPMTLRAQILPISGIERLACLGTERSFAQQLGHAACSCPPRMRRSSIAAKASNILRICGGL